MANITDLGKAYKKAQDIYKEKEAELKKLGTAWEEAETELLNAMVEEGVPSIRIEGYGLFSMSVQNYLSVNAANKERFFKYLETSGNYGILKLDINPKTLTTWLKGHLDELIKTNQDSGLDQVEARQKSLEFLNENGANYFTKRGISLRAD